MTKSWTDNVLREDNSTDMSERNTRKSSYEI